MGLFSKEKISKGGDKEGKDEEKRISGEAYNTNKQAPKSKIESRLHYASEPARSYMQHLLMSDGYTQMGICLCQMTAQMQSNQSRFGACCSKFHLAHVHAEY